MIIIPDISHHQKGYELAEKFIDTATEPYIIFKATEGESYTDPQLFNYAGRFMCRLCAFNAADLAHIGLYHYCRLDNKVSRTEPELKAWVEMEHFLDVCHQVRGKLRNDYGYDAKIIPILDWEGNGNLSHPCKERYLTECVRIIAERTQTDPIIYMSSSVTNSKEWKSVISEYPNTGLWVAHYNVKQPKVYNGTWAAWQFTSTPFDLSFVKPELFFSPTHIM